MILIYGGAAHPLGRAQGTLLQLRIDGAQHQDVGAGHAREQQSWIALK